MKNHISCIALICVATVFCSPAANAQAQSASCGVLVDPLDSAAKGSHAYLKSIQELDVGQIASAFSGEELKALKEFEQARREVLPDMKNFVSKLEDLAYTIKKCAR